MTTARYASDAPEVNIVTATGSLTGPVEDVDAHTVLMWMRQVWEC
ncbi:hypothetical protein ABIB25_000660 [Nakamurella sp. UYEF19]